MFRISFHLFIAMQIIFVFILMLMPYIVSVDYYFFREDNFWSYESQIFRRAMSGQIIWYMDLISNNGPLLYSILMFLTFSVGSAIVLRISSELLTKTECILLLISPMYLIYSVDSEIFVALTALLFFFRFARNAPIFIINIILFFALIREISILVYFPILLTIMVRNRYGVLYLIASIAFYVILLNAIWGNDYLSLEQNYWPAPREWRLEQYGLYNFLDSSVIDVLKKHVLETFRGDFPYNILFWLSGFIFINSIVFLRSKSPSYKVYFAFMYALCSILSYDHGRYFYVFFFLSILSTDRRCLSLYQEGLDRVAVLLGISAQLSHFHSLRYVALRWVRVASLVAVVVLPSAYFAAGEFARPRVVAFVDGLIAMGEEFLMPGSPGERVIR